MDIGILAVLTGIYKLAEKTGLLEYVKSYGEKTFDALYEKLVQDTVFDSLVKKFFKNDMAKKFAAALDKIAPKNETIKRKFLLSILIDSTITETIEQMKKGRLPQRHILIPIFQRLIMQQHVASAVDQFVDTLYDELKKDQEFVNLVILTMYELLGQQHKELMNKLETALRATPEKEEKFKIDISKLPPTGKDLFGREEHLKQLDKAWSDPHTHILCLVAWGGVGKTALVNEWLNRMEQDDYRGAQRVFGWSFYSQGTREVGKASADLFFNNALKFFGFEGEIPTSPWDRSSELLKIILQQPTLLILDGLEPLQYPPGPVHKELHDKGMQAFLKNLSRQNNGLCIITTRCEIKDIAATVGKSTKEILLENLDENAGAELLQHLGVMGTKAELKKTSQKFKGHALALNLLGSYLAVVHRRDIRKQDLVPSLYEDEEQGSHARNVMESYEVWLKSKPELDLLYLMGLFDRPAPRAAIDVLLQEPAITGLTENLQKISPDKMQYTLKRLSDLKLLARMDETAREVLDCHPLVREHFSQKLKARSEKRKAKGENPWQEAHSRLYDYYKNLPQKLYGKELPDTLEEMEPLFAAVAHGCQAGKHKESLYDLYWDRILRKDAMFVNYKLGAFGSDLSALSNFFEIPWSKIVTNLTDADKAVTLNYAGFGLRALGRLREAAQPMQACLDYDIKHERWYYAAQAAGNLSELYLTLGEVEQAVSSASQSVEFADKTDDAFQRYGKRTTSGETLHQAGKLNESEKLFKEAENIQKKDQPSYQYLYGLAGFRFCDLLLSQGKVREVLERAKQTLEWVSRMNWLLDIALDKLSLGRAYLLEAVGNMTVTSQVTVMFQRAADYLNQAVAGLREAGTQDHLPRGLFARAFYYRVQNQFPQAWEDLEEARELAERGEMKLWLVDYHLEASRLLISEHTLAKVDNLRKGDLVDRLKMHVEQADKLVQQTGYHRRDPEVELGYAGLFLAQGDQVKAREHLDRGKKLLEKMGIRCWDWEVKKMENEIAHG